MKIPAIETVAAAGSQSGARPAPPAPPAPLHPFTSDSAAFSDAALAALVQSQAGSATSLSDADAARIGADLAQRDPALFRALDTSRSGTLTASELAAGRDKIAAAIRSGQLAPARPPAASAAAPAAGAPAASGEAGGPPPGGGPRPGAGPTAGGASSAASKIAELVAQEILQLHRQGVGTAEIAMRTRQTEKQVQAALSAG